jgi:hypothetical protein
MKRGIALIGGLVAAASTAQAQSLDMCYQVTDLGGGLYQYDFELTPDAGWAPGMGWRWLIFGDEPGTCCGGTGVSPLADFQEDPASFPVGPWTGVGRSSGGHNGPDMQHVLDYWIPASATETLRWSGTSSNNLRPGELLFSTLAGTQGGAVAADFKEAELCEAPCYPDCDGNETLDVFDFLCFQDAFVAAVPYADCDGNSVFDVFDFLCFQDAFVVGCP